MGLSTLAATLDARQGEPKSVKRAGREEHLSGAMNGQATSAATGAATIASTVELAAAGDEDAFARLVSAYHADMARVAYVVCGDQALAEDAVQSAWEIAWRKLRSLHDPSRVRAWLVSVAANEARQAVRRRRRSVIAIDVHLSADAGSDPSAGIERIDLARAMARLSADDRALLALRYIVGLDAEELGVLTGRSASGVRTRLCRLTERLRKELPDV
jgi:RNA polymerase sigma-70 factor (ECF subfamily)